MNAEKFWRLKEILDRLIVIEIDNRPSDKPEADKIREEGNDLWYDLTQKEKELLLYYSRDRDQQQERVKDGQSTARQHPE